MSLRKNKAFRFVGYTLVGLAIFTGIADIAQRALTGDWHTTYYSAKLIPWTYGSAFVAICAMALAGLIALAIKFLKR